jgi:PAS domain S-box-containing protein
MFEALAESAQDAIVTIDEHSTILFANASSQRVFGYAPEELVGKTLTELMPDRLREKHRGGFGRYLKSGRRNIPWSGVELPGLRKDGTEVPLEISFGEFQAEDGRRVFSGFMRDVSERTRIRRELEAALRSRDEVLSIVSHDLRNPVSTVLMSAANLGDRELKLSDEERRKHIDVIKRSAQSMNRLIQDLLDVKQIEARRLTINRKCEHPDRLAKEAYEAFQPIAGEKGQQLECIIAPALPRVSADRERILQVLANYLNNAVKFAPADGRIVLRVERKDGGVRFGVQDNGPGIPAGERRDVFTRFWQAKETAHLGSGLGLAIAKGIVEAHGGRVSMESAPGAGSTFYFELPHSSECG